MNFLVWSWFLAEPLVGMGLSILLSSEFLQKSPREEEKRGDFVSQICVSLMFYCVFNGEGGEVDNEN